MLAATASVYPHDGAAAAGVVERGGGVMARNVTLILVTLTVAVVAYTIGVGTGHATPDYSDHVRVTAVTRPCQPFGAVA